MPTVSTTMLEWILLPNLPSMVPHLNKPTNSIHWSALAWFGSSLFFQLMWCRCCNFISSIDLTRYCRARPLRDWSLSVSSLFPWHFRWTGCTCYLNLPRCCLHACLSLGCSSGHEVVLSGWGFAPHQVTFDMYTIINWRPSNLDRVIEFVAENPFCIRFDYHAFQSI